MNQNCERMRDITQLCDVLGAYENEEFAQINSDAYARIPYATITELSAAANRLLNYISKTCTEGVCND